MALETSWARYWTTRDGRSRERDTWWALDHAKFERLRRCLPSEGVALEVGCGSARLSGLVGAEGLRAVGLDYCAKATSLAQATFVQAGVRGDAVMGDAFRLPFRDESLDVVLSTGLLEHFEEPGPIVGEMVRVLRPGGLFYSDVVPRKFSLMCALDGIGKARNGHDGIPEHALTSKQLSALLQRSGLEAVQVVPAGVFPPRLPVLGRLRVVREAQGLFCYLTRRLWSALDGTPLAERLGVYYLCLGTRRGASSVENDESDGQQD